MPRQKPRKLHPSSSGGDIIHWRYDPASPSPDFTTTSLGAACHLGETGHPQAVGCCDKVDVNGRHLLPRFRRP